MKNVEMNLEGNILTIKVDITKEFGVSHQLTLFFRHHTPVDNLYHLTTPT